eukprot:1486804-Prymnesium_polylepis.1
MKTRSAREAFGQAPALKCRSVGGGSRGHMRDCGLSRSWPQQRLWSEPACPYTKAGEAEASATEIAGARAQ